MNTIWTSVGSILFGLVALSIPIIGVANKNRLALTAVSFSACGISLCIQIHYVAIMVKLEDWSGLIDTIYTTAVVSTALLVITIILNFLFIFAEIRRKQGKEL